MSQRVENLQRQAAQAADQVELQRRRVASVERNLARQRSLRQSDFISESALQQKEEEVLDQRAQLAVLTRNAGSADSDLAAARSEVGIARLKAGNGIAALRRQVSELEQLISESEERREIVLTAPVDGIVTTVLLTPGQSVATSQPLLTIIPEGSVLEAHLLVPTRSAAFIKPGQEVALRYAAFPYQQFGHAVGEVTQVGQVVLQAADVGLTVPGAEPGYRVTVRVPSQSVMAYGKPVSLRHGMAIDSDIQLDRRRLMDWIFEPLLALHGRL
jgi:membrane fusion protein